MVSILGFSPAPPALQPPANAAAPATAAAVVMDSSTAFAAIALAAVSWDGVLTMAGSRALRHALDYRQPYQQLIHQGHHGGLDGSAAG